MAAIDNLISQISDKKLQEEIKRQVHKISQHKKFGLVFESHRPECTPLYGVPITVGSKVALKAKKIEDIYVVTAIKDKQVTGVHTVTHKAKTFAIDDLVRIAEFGDPIYPYLQKVDSISTAPNSNLWHTLIEADNYHALQLLDYLYTGKVDCIYIDPPYNSGAEDWKYNNNYVDQNDAYKDSKWLSFMQKRLKLAKKLLNPKDSVLICTIDEKEYLNLGLLLRETFPEARIQMISTVISNNGNARAKAFSRTNEFIYFVMFGNCGPNKLKLNKQWLGNVRSTSARETSGFQWGRMLRGGNSGRRAYSPGCFYPVYFDKNAVYQGIGKSLPISKDRHTVATPKGLIAVWPIHLDGSEGCWSCQPKVFKELYRKGYIKFGKKVTQRGVRITYIQSGMQKRIENGEIEIIGREPKNGTVILNTNGSDAKYIPGTQWDIGSHDATYFGSKLISKIIGKDRFNFPKSLYAVHDTLHFFVANKPNALVLDFFAGSGTTLHAINLLNKEDGGHRRCIMVTNNELSQKEENQLTQQGYHPGDKQWEKFGVARYVAWPRTVCSIKGVDINGKPLKGEYGTISKQYIPDKKHKGDYKRISVHDYPEMKGMKKSDGFKSNVIYFKLGFLDKDSVALGQQFKALLSTLWMKAGCVGKCPKLDNKKSVPDMLILPKNHFAVLLRERDFAKFKEVVNNNKNIKTIFIVTDSDDGYRGMISQLKSNLTYQLYKDYLDNFKINVRG